MPTQPTRVDAAPKLSAKLRAVRELRPQDRPLKVEQLAEAFLCSESTAYRILENQLDETVATLRHAIATAPRDVADALVESLLGGTPYDLPRRRAGDARETDLNGDGRTDLLDQLQSVTDVFERGQGLLRRVVAAAAAGQRMLTEDQGEEVAAELGHVAEAVELGRAIVLAITLRKQRPGMRAVV